MISVDQFRDRVSHLQVYRKYGKPAPHKPLLLLLAIGHLLRGEERMQPYKVLVPQLEGLLRRFGPFRATQKPEQPIFRLSHDHLWVLENFNPKIHLDASNVPRAGALLRSNVRCGLPRDVHQLLAAKPDLRLWTICYLLDSYFPASYHQDILRAVSGDHQLLPFVSDHAEARSRDSEFSQQVIRAYEARCAICGYGLRIDNELLGLEAAHIRWHFSGGPDHVRNGLALCTVHHKAFDRGGISLSDDLRLLVSSDMHGRNEAWSHWFGRHRERSIRSPQESDHVPDPEHLRWHRHQVFRGRR